MRVVNLRGQSVQLLMKGLDGLRRGRQAARGKSLRIEPRTQAAWLRIERRRRRPRALQVRQKMPVPGAVFDHGEQHRPISSRLLLALPPTVDRRATWPPRLAVPAAGMGLAMPYPCAKSHPSCSSIRPWSTVSTPSAITFRRNASASPRTPFRMDRFSELIEHIPHKTLVDLQNIGGQALQIDEGGVAGAKVVHADLHAGLTAGREHLGAERHILQGAGFQHLQLQMRWLDARMRRQPRAQAVDEIRLLQFESAHIHAHRYFKSALLPGFHLRERALDHPIAHLGRSADGLQSPAETGPEAAGRARGVASESGLPRRSPSPCACSPWAGSTARTHAPPARGGCARCFHGGCARSDRGWDRRCSSGSFPPAWPRRAPGPAWRNSMSASTSSACG